MMEAKKIKIAIEFLKGGQSFQVDDLRLGMNNEEEMYVTGFSQYFNIENMTKHIALCELDEIKKKFKLLFDVSQELEKFTLNKKIKYNLAFNYGMGSIGICYEKDGRLEWEIELE